MGKQEVLEAINKEIERLSRLIDVLDVHVPKLDLQELLQLITREGDIFDTLHSRRYMNTVSHENCAPNVSIMQKLAEIDLLQLEVLRYAAGLDKERPPTAAIGLELMICAVNEATSNIVVKQINKEEKRP